MDEAKNLCDLAESLNWNRKICFRNSCRVDLVFVAVKHHHLQEAIHDMENGIGENTLIVSVTNGLDSIEQIGTIYGIDKVVHNVTVEIDAGRHGNRITRIRAKKLLSSDRTGENVRNSNATEPNPFQINEGHRSIL